MITLTRCFKYRLYPTTDQHTTLVQWAGRIHDTTKSATRRWCSTACMNRARSHQHYLERKRQGGA